MFYKKSVIRPLHAEKARGYAIIRAAAGKRTLPLKFTTGYNYFTNFLKV